MFNRRDLLKTLAAVPILGRVVPTKRAPKPTAPPNPAPRTRRLTWLTIAEQTIREYEELYGHQPAYLVASRTIHDAILEEIVGNRAFAGHVELEVAGIPVRWTAEHPSCITAWGPDTFRPHCCNAKHVISRTRAQARKWIRQELKKRR